MALTDAAAVAAAWQTADLVSDLPRFGTLRVERLPWLWPSKAKLYRLTKELYRFGRILQAWDIEAKPDPGSSTVKVASLRSRNVQCMQSGLL